MSLGVAQERSGRREMEVHVGMPLNPIIKREVPCSDMPDEAIHEFEELDATTALTSPVATSKAGNKVDVPRITLGRRLLQKRCSLLFIARLLIRVPLFFHASKFMIGKSPPPIADNSGRIRL